MAEEQLHGPPDRLRIRVAVALAGAAVLVGLLVNARHYYPFITDDAFISLRYSQRLLHGDGLTWTDGPPVEGYSNLLWTLLCAGLGALGVELVLASRILGLAGMAAAAVAIAWAVRPGRPVEWAAALVGVFGFALAGPVGAWLAGGLEQPLVAALLAWALAASAPLLALEPPARRHIAVPGALLALLTLTRPDGAVLVAAVCLGIVLLFGMRRVGWQRALLLAALPAAAFMGQMLFRVIYYDAWIPNTALVKIAFTSDRLRTGAAYLAAAVRSSGLLLALGALPLAIAVRRRGPRWRHACLAWIAALVWAAYIFFVGGDIFPAHRQWIPVLVAVCMAAALGICLMAERWPRRAWAIVGAAVAVVALSAALQPGDHDNDRAVTERWMFNGEVVGRLLHRAFGDRQPLMAANAVGAICYYAELPCLDMLGLNDRTIARRRPADFGTGFIGHELGDGAYAMSRRPDLVVFCGPTGRVEPCGRGEKEMAALPEFRRDYQMVLFRGTEPREQGARIWVRRTGRIGIRSGGDAVTVPGYLMAAHRDARAELDGQGRIGLRMPAGSTAQVDLALAAGRWQLRVESDRDPAVATSVAILSPASPPSPLPTDESGGAQLGFSVDPQTSGAETRVRVQVRAGRPLHLRSLTIDRR